LLGVRNPVTTRGALALIAVTATAATGTLLLAPARIAARGIAL